MDVRTSWTLWRSVSGLKNGSVGVLEWYAQEETLGIGYSSGTKEEAERDETRLHQNRRYPTSISCIVITCIASEELSMLLAVISYAKFKE